MRAIIARIGVLGLAVAACETNPSGPPGPIEQNGFLVYGNGAPSKIACDQRPVQLNGNHSDKRLIGPCRFVRVAGAHNDISIDVAPGGRIDITGAHNDVTWFQSLPGPPPTLMDHGASNTFHQGRPG